MNTGILDPNLERVVLNPVMSVPGRGRRLLARSFARRQPHLTQTRRRDRRAVSAAAQSSSSESTSSESPSANREDVYIRNGDRFRILNCLRSS